MLQTHVCHLSYAQHGGSQRAQQYRKTREMMASQKGKTHSSKALGCSKLEQALIGVEGCRQKQKAGASDFESRFTDAAAPEQHLHGV